MILRNFISSIFTIAFIYLMVSFKPNQQINNQLISIFQLDSFPKPLGYINDFEGVLTDNEEAQLSSIVMNFEKQTDAQIAIVSIDNYNPSSDLASYSIGLFNAWGIGDKNKNNGVLILFSKGMYELRISTGSGIEDKLTDEECQKIIDNFIIPEFKKGDFYEGLNSAIEAIKIELI